MNYSRKEFQIFTVSTPTKNKSKARIEATFVSPSRARTLSKRDNSLSESTLLLPFDSATVVYFDIVLNTYVYIYIICIMYRAS